MEKQGWVGDGRPVCTPHCSNRLPCRRHLCGGGQGRQWQGLSPLPALPTATLTAAAGSWPHHAPCWGLQLLGWPSIAPASGLCLLPAAWGYHLPAAGEAGRGRIQGPVPAGKATLLRELYLPGPAGPGAVCTGEGVRKHGTGRVGR